MDESQIKIMGRDELIKQADSLGVDYAKGEGLNSLRAKVSAALGLSVAQGNEPAKTAIGRAIEKGQKRYKVTVHTDKTDKQPVPVTVNGYTYLLPRGVECDVPEPVVEVLRNAVGHELDSKTGEMRDVLSYPYSAVPA